MGWLLRKCVECGKYTLKKDKCPYCGGKVKIPHPAKFSPDDKYTKYRRMLREESKIEKNNNNGKRLNTT